MSIWLIDFGTSIIDASKVFCWTTLTAICVSSIYIYESYFLQPEKNETYHLGILMWFVINEWCKCAGGCNYMATFKWCSQQILIWRKPVTVFRLKHDFWFYYGLKYLRYPVLPALYIKLLKTLLWSLLNFEFDLNFFIKAFGYWQYV